MSREAPVRFREGLGVKFPRATRLVICCRGTACEAMTVMRGIMSKLRLTVNETKTRLCRVPEETFDFLGYTIGRCWSPVTEPVPRVAVDGSIRGTHGAEAEVVRPTRSIRFSRATRSSTSVQSHFRLVWSLISRLRRSIFFADGFVPM